MNSDRVMPTGRVPLVQRRQNEVSEGLQRRLGAKDLKAVSFGSLASMLVGEGNGTPLRYSCQENPMDGEAS